jgi:hypothetical protein
MESGGRFARGIIFYAARRRERYGSDADGVRARLSISRADLTRSLAPLLTFDSRRSGVKQTRRQAGLRPGDEGGDGCPLSSTQPFATTK